MVFAIKELFLWHHKFFSHLSIGKKGYISMKFDCIHPIFKKIYLITLKSDIIGIIQFELSIDPSTNNCLLELKCELFWTKTIGTLIVIVR
jgi:hypothetical protein